MLMLRHPNPLLRPAHTQQLLRAAARTLTVSRKAIKAPGSDPLDVWKKECVARKLCDEDGGRVPGSHWTVCIAIATDHAIKVRN
jgi:hypothetical protein